jgi:perosamine synthetase
MKETLALFGGPKAVTMRQPPYPVIGPEEIAAVARVMISRELSDIGRGPVVAAMEDSYARHFKTRYALSFSSGTASIAAALFAVGVRPGTEVLTTSNTWISAITAIAHAGGTPVFCDLKPNTLHIDPREIRRKAGPHTKAVIVTHLFGIPADMRPILDVARALKLAVIEDGSHAHGATYRGRFVGTIGDIGCFSLQASKAIVAGEGGFMLTNSKRYYERAMVPGHHGERLRMTTLAELKPFVPAGGYCKYRISPVEAAIATEQLKRLDALNAARQANFDRLRRGLAKCAPFIRWHRVPPRSTRGWYGTPAFYEYTGGVSCARFHEACAAEGVPVWLGGYGDWARVPLFQDMRLYSQLWVVKHSNGVEFRPVKPGELPNEAQARQKLLIFSVPAEETPQLVDQWIAAVAKVSANMPALKKRSARRKR